LLKLFLIVVLAFFAYPPEAYTQDRPRRFIDLSHVVEHGMRTYPGLPAPEIGDHLGYAQSRTHYAPGTEFQIARISMVANTGTYLDAPSHRFEGGTDLAGLALATVADVPAVAVHVAGRTRRAITREDFEGIDVSGKAVLVHTGWVRHWGTERYFDGHPHLTGDAAEYLSSHGAVLVGIDSLNIDDMADRRRPVHTTLLAAGIPVVEHMRGLEQLPAQGFRFTAVPVKVKGMGTFPVRAYAVL
jgi:arylformamidase